MKMKNHQNEARENGDSRKPPERVRSLLFTHVHWLTVLKNLAEPKSNREAAEVR